jgi:hypothetical protein
MGALLLGVVLTAAPVQAAFLTGGSSQPGNSSTQGFVDVQVYTLNPAGGYGTGNAALEAAAATAGAGGLNKFLYVYETTNVSPPSPDVAQNTVQTIPANISAPFKVAGISFNAHPAPGAPLVDGAGTGFTFGAGDVGINPADAAAITPNSVFTTASSVASTYNPSLVGSGVHSSLWGYTSNQAPVIVNTSIQDGGNSAAAATLGVPEPSSMLLLASGAAGMVSYRLKRRKS